MKKNMKTQQSVHGSDTHSKTQKSAAAKDICIAARLVLLGLLIALANAVFNFIYFGGQKKVKTTSVVKCINRFVNRCALSFNRLESKLSFKKNNDL